MGLCAVSSFFRTFLAQAPANAKLAVLYTLDAILKLVGGYFVDFSKDRIVRVISSILPSVCFELSPRLVLRDLSLCVQVDATTEGKIVRTAKLWVKFSVFSSDVVDGIVSAANACNAARAARGAQAPASAVPQQRLLSIGQPAPQQQRGPPSTSSLLGSMPVAPHSSGHGLHMQHHHQMPHHAHTPSHSAPPSDPNAPSHPEFDAHPITHAVHSALGSIPPLASAQMQLDASACTRAIARVDPALSEQVAWEVRRVQHELGGLPPMAPAAGVSDFAAYLVDVILYHQEKMQAQAPTHVGSAPSLPSMPAALSSQTPTSAAPHNTAAASGWMSAADAAHRSDVLDGWCINVHDASAVSALHEGLPFQCLTDGARFRTQAALHEHEQWLSSKVNSDLLGVVSQGWFKPTVDWRQCQPGTDNSGQDEKYVSFFDRQVEQSAEAHGDEAEGAGPAVSQVVPVDPTQTECPLCGEAFKKHFDASLQKWVYVGVVQVDGVIYDAEAWADEQSARQRARKRPRVEPHNSATVPQKLPARQDSLDEEPATLQSTGNHAEAGQFSPVFPRSGQEESDDDDDLFGGSPEHPATTSDSRPAAAQDDDEPDDNKSDISA